MFANRGLESLVLLTVDVAIVFVAVQSIHPFCICHIAIRGLGGYSMLQVATTLGATVLSPLC